MIYKHPETGALLTEDTSWMKDLENVDVLSMLLSKHIAYTMQDIYGEPQQSNQPATQLGKVKEIIAKYSK